MKIICNQKLLANKIGIVQKAINSKTTLDLLKGVLIVTKQDEIILKGYDLEIGISCTSRGYSRGKYSNKFKIIWGYHKKITRLIC
mgnify:CR=1 FL=1